MYYGGDYNPEQWPEEVWLEDARLMREARVNLVSVGIFSWARIQPSEGVFDFVWLDRVLDILHAHGIGVCLATATASPPPWLGIRYPSALPEDRDGSRFWHGSRQAYAPTSPDYRRLAGELVAAIAERYASHPAVQLWHVNNEFGCHLPADYSDNAARGFRVWLAERYAGIEDLNRAWGTAFWSQRYGSFDEIVPPRKAPYSLNPAGVLDFKRFTSDALLDLYLMEKGIIRDAGATQPVTTNFMGAFEPLDYHRWAPHLDVISDDSYPDPNDPDAWRSAAFTRDLIRSLKPDTPWILMEQASNAVNWRPSNAPKAPGEMSALSMQAVARGADGVMFFQWRQSSAGSEKFHSAMLPHAGTGTRTWREVVGLGAALEELPPLGRLRARVALVYDWENRWAIEQPDHPVTLDYLAQIQRWHSALLDLGVLVDVVDAEADLGHYDTVFAPLLYLLTEHAAQGILSVLERGGTVVTGPFSDIVDEHDRFRAGGFTTLLGETFRDARDRFRCLGADSAWPAERTSGGVTRKIRGHALCGGVDGGHRRGPGELRGRPRGRQAGRHDAHAGRGEGHLRGDHPRRRGPALPCAPGCQARGGRPGARHGSRPAGRCDLRHRPRLPLRDHHVPLNPVRGRTSRRRRPAPRPGPRRTRRRRSAPPAPPASRRRSPR